MQLKSKIKMTHGWVAEWCDSCPIDECGDAELDRAHYVRKQFRTREEAERYAADVMAKRLDFFGCVLIHEFQWVECDFAPWLVEMEHIGEAVEVS